MTKFSFWVEYPFKSVKICRRENHYTLEKYFFPPLLIEFLFEEFVRNEFYDKKKCFHCHIVSVVLHSVKELRLFAFVCRFACCLSCTDCRATWHGWRLMNSSHLSLVRGSGCTPLWSHYWNVSQGYLHHQTCFYCIQMKQLDICKLSQVLCHFKMNLRP